MKFTVAKINFERALSIAERFTGKNVTLPVLSHVLLSVVKGSLHIRATNLESAAEIAVSGTDAREGSVCVPAKTMNAITQAGKDEKIFLEEKQGGLGISSGRKEVKIHGVSPDEFPLIPKIAVSGSFSLSSALLQSGLAGVIPAVSPSEFKPELGGVFFTRSGNTLHLVATDTFRLAEKKIPLQKIQEKPVSFILPARVGQELFRILGTLPEGETTVGVGENQAVISIDGTKITTRLVEGNFPDYERVIPQAHEVSCFLPREELYDAVRGAGIFTSKLQDVRLHFKGKTLTINAQNSDIGEYRTTLAIAPVEKEIQVSFNQRYLLDGITALSEEEIFFGLGGPERPSLLRDRSDNSFCYVLMPLQIT